MLFGCWPGVGFLEVKRCRSQEGTVSRGSRLRGPRQTVESERQTQASGAVANEGWCQLKVQRVRTTYRKMKHRLGYGSILRETGYGVFTFLAFLSLCFGSKAGLMNALLLGQMMHDEHPWQGMLGDRTEMIRRILLRRYVRIRELDPKVLQRAVEVRELGSIVRFYQARLMPHLKRMILRRISIYVYDEAH